MNRLYIVEGQDRCGKSTLVNTLRQKLTNPKTVTIHSGKPPKGVNVESWTKQHYKNLYQTIDIMLLDGYDIILDRSWIGEMVYGPLYRDTNLTEKDMGISGVIPDFQTVLVILTDDAASIAQRSDGESMSDDLYMLETERKLFADAFNKTHLEQKNLFDWQYDEFSIETINAIADVMINNPNSWRNVDD